MIKTLKFETHNNKSGSLIALESLKNIPFEIKRIYYLFANDFTAKRGQHAHKNLKQIYIAVSGSCKVIFDNGAKKNEMILDNPKIGVLIDDIVWREISSFSKDCVLLVLASDFYTEEDYIRNYSEFLEYTKNIT